ncbi:MULTISPECIES: DUF4367 domain-containing protein [Dehalobacter]|jgi:hypothetical protein|uniref:DUF4367 domain-containing protein n=2 Tax=Dehalobacter restrictus TaxID=55583 RepID=A0A857DG07_9FIRM|nr:MULTISPECIES: DUF4367 domain-containing protein [Dehalobacter]AHF09053.1 membrane protein [Dehalobacter restrictus DSM 9455]MCG1024940.1 DUF4367 domain-containing protein [Dehalobacter sp.]QGZ99577.1 DUF4367 domain-containing protein [Dehalobacter restrictus]
MNFKFNDAMLKIAVIKADLYELNALPSDDNIDHMFSPEFERKMKALIRQSKNNKSVSRRHRKLVAILVAAIILLFGSAMSVSAVRETVFKFITEVYEKYTQVSFEKMQSSQATNEEFTVYAPSQMPAGFELINENLNGIVSLEYEKGNDYLNYEQKKLDKVSMQINTEGIDLEELEFNGLPAKYYSNQGVQNLIWYDNNYMYMISSTLNKDMVLDIAKSVELYQK